MQALVDEQDAQIARQEHIIKALSAQVQDLQIQLHASQAGAGDEGEGRADRYDEDEAGHWGGEGGIQGGEDDDGGEERGGGMRQEREEGGGEGGESDGERDDPPRVPDELGLRDDYGEDDDNA